MRRWLARRMAVLLAVLLGAGVLAGCAPSNSGDGGLGGPGIDVDTPQLRALKKQAGIAPCPQRGGHNELPDVTLPCFGGGRDVALNELSGPLVVNFWAGWCWACRRELPYYEKVSKEYAGRLRVLGVDFQDPVNVKAMRLLMKTGATFPQVADPQGELAVADPLPRITKLPAVVLVDAQGRVVHAEIVQIHSVGQLRDLIRDHLGISA